MSPSPWPQPTPPPKRRKSTRQVIADQSQVDQAQVDCQLNSGNDVFSCFPTADTSIDQREWASFVWNSRRPELTQTNLVDVFLFRADSQQQILHYHNLPNPTDQAGLLRAQVNDTWFGSDGNRFDGTALPFPFYWVIIRSDKTLDGNQMPQPTFTARQTAVLDSVASSSAAAAASSSALAASLSHLSATATGTSRATGTNNPTASGNVQLGSSGSSFPHWAIAVIVILGFLAIAATCILAFLIIRRMRRRRRLEIHPRNSIGSASPMIKNRNNPEGEMTQHYDSPLPPPSTAPAFAATTGDNASSISDSGGPFSGADAAIMADAFRKMLRKPDFAGRPVEEGDTPPDAGDSDTDPGLGNIVISDELAGEGKDIRSVSSSRGVKVEGADPR